MINQNKSKSYNHSKILLELLEFLFSFSVLIILAFTDVGKKLEFFIFTLTSNDYLSFIIFLTIIGFIITCVNLPVNFYSTYILEHKYNLSNQTFLSWFLEKSKSLVISAIILIPFSLLVYFLLKKEPNNWWLYLTIFIFFFSLFLTRIAPTLIFPLFYKFKPIDDKNLTEKLSRICNEHGINLEGIFSFNFSKDTKKANAGFTGIGKSKRILISDTLIENLSDNEILSVFAHELGHYKLKHIPKNILISLITTSFIFFVSAKIYDFVLIKLNYSIPYQISALPILALIISFLSILILPISNLLSRYFEYQADEFAIKILGEKKYFIAALKKLSKINLADEEPNPIIEFLFFSHPSISKRINRIEFM